MSRASARRQAADVYSLLIPAATARFHDYAAYRTIPAGLGRREMGLARAGLRIQ